MRADGRFDGHIVQGHVDGVGPGPRAEVARRVGRDRDRAAGELERYLVEKGSVSRGRHLVDRGGDRDGAFSVALIPYTLQVTNLRDAQAGDPSTSRPTSSPSTWSGSSAARGL